MVKLSDNFHWSSHLSWRYSSAHRWNYLCGQKVPKWLKIDRCITGDRRILWTECIHGIVSVPVISWISAFDSNSYRSPSRSLVMVKLSDSYHWSSSVLKIFVSTSVQLSVAVQGLVSMNRSVYYNWSFIGWTECNHRFSRILFTVISWIQDLWFEQLSITVQVLVMVKLSDVPFDFTSVLNIFVSTSFQLSLLRLKVPRVNESIGVFELIVVSFGQKVILQSFVVSLNCDQLNTSLWFEQLSITVGSSWWWSIGQLPLVFTSVLKIFVTSVQLSIAVQGTWGDWIDRCIAIDRRILPDRRM